MDIATYSLFLDFGSGFEDFTEKILLQDGYAPRACIGKAGRHEIQTVTLRLQHSAGLSARLSQAEDDIPARLLRNGQVVMLGIVRPYNTSRAALNRMDPITLSIMDRSAALEQYVFDTKRWTALTLLNRSDTSTSLVHRLFAEAGVEASDVLVDFDMAETIPYYALSNGDYISDRIQEALYEYGLAYRATLDGKFRILDISPDEIVPSLTLHTPDLRTEFSLTRSDSSQKGSIVKWYPVLTKTGAELFLADEDAQTIASGAVYPPGADAEGYRLPYDISEYAGNGKLLSVGNPRLEYTPSSLAVTVHAEFGEDGCSAYLKSTATGAQAITRFAVVADIWYRGSSYGQQIVPGTKPKTYTAKVISDAGSALRLARILASRQTFAQQSYGFDSALVMEPGLVVRVVEDKVSYLDVSLRILSREFDVITGLYRYTGEGMSEIDLTTTVEHIDAAENALGKPRKGEDGAPGAPGAPGSPGASASDFTIFASPATYSLSSRGKSLADQTVTLFCNRLNIDGSGNVSWSVGDGVSLSEESGSPVTVTIPADSVLASFMATCTVAGYEPKTITILGVRSGDAKPMYLGVLAAPPETTSEGPLFYSPTKGGDYYLGTDMIPYWYNGTAFTSEGLSDAPNYADIMSHCSADALRVSNPIPVTSAIYGYFENLAATDAYIGKLRTKVIKLMDEGAIESEIFESGKQGFQMKSDGYFEAINAILSNAIINGAGIFRGVIESDPLTTTTQSDSSDPIGFSPKTHWYSNEMYDAVSLAIGEVLQTVTGSYQGKTLSQATRLAEGGRARLGYTSGSATSIGSGKKSGEDNYVNTSPSVLCATLTVPAYSTVVHYNLYINSVRTGSIYTYGAVTKNGVAIATSYTGGDRTLSGDIAVVAGDIIATYVRAGMLHDSGGYTYNNVTGTGTLTAYSTLIGKGLFLKYSDATFGLIPMGVYGNNLTITGYTQTYKYAIGNGFVSGVSSLPLNEIKAASGTFKYNSVDYPITGVMRTSTGIAVFHSNGAIALKSSDGSHSGFYDASGSYALLSSVAGAEMMNINSKEKDGYSIGMVKRFLNIVSKNMIAENYDSSSSREKKKDISPFLESALDVLQEVLVVNYRYKGDEDEYLHTGFIAEDTPDKLTGSNHKSMSLSDNIGMLIKAVQELYSKVNKLENQIIEVIPEEVAADE